MRKTRFALFQSMIALLLCFSMLVGTTFAWFTDGVSSGTNTIAAGVLDVEMEYLDAAGTWQKVTEATEVLDKNALWEPGYTEVAYLKVSNLGNLALKYGLGVQINGERGSINAVGESFLLSDHIRFGVIASETQQTYADRMQARNALTDVKFIKEGTGSSGVLYPQNGGENQPSETYITMVVFMPEEVGNAANYATGQQPPEIQLGIQLVATQAEYEADAFGTDYDAAADLPGFNFPENTFGGSVSADVKNENNQVAENVTIQGSNTNAVIPAGVQLEDGAEKLTLEVSTLDNSEANISLGKNDELRPLNVHVEGVSADNTVPMEIYLKEAAAKGLNAGNLKVYHVENGTTVEMTQVNEFTAHNQFKYDPATGDIILYMATFSEIDVVADTENAWNGEFDYSWYTNPSARNAAADYTIANADQLAAFGKIVGGMADGIDRDRFAGKTVKLIADVNLGDAEENNSSLIFHPIGYYYKDGDSTVKSFEGTFDGQGHKISNFYQNTWEIEGDYDGTYYKDAMGLFGYVYNGTVKNLTVSNFSSDGEYTPTGVIAAFADGNSTFENIAITNCNPRVYNTGNGGIIGIAGDTSAANDDHITLKNITVDNSNKISALWGSYDVACGGLVGMYRGNVDDNGNKTDDTISFENCHVAAQMDVYNDVCGNYQYYAYRYAGMIIGSVRHNTTSEDGTKTIPNMTGISATGCTVNYGDWNDYYYCEKETNGHPSYSGPDDYKFSRVPHSELKFTDSNGNGVVDKNERASVTGCKHNHTAAENNQAIYLPFHQLFTGYGWGVNSVGLEKYSGIVTDQGITEGDQEESVEKFETKFTEDFLYRVGNQNTVSAGSLFAAIDEEKYPISDAGVYVRIDKLYENSNVECTFTSAEEWENATLKFTGTGVVDIVIQDYDFCTPTVLKLEVVDGYNVTKQSEWKNDVTSVLLCDIDLTSEKRITGNKVFYGNGFTIDAINAPYSGVDYDSESYVIYLENSALNNVIIQGKVYPEIGGTRTADYYRALVMTNGECEISDCFLANTASPIRNGGNLELVNSVLKGGAYANLDIRNGHTILDNVTTINQFGESILSGGEEIVGLGIVVYQEGGTDDLKITIRNNLTQYNIISEAQTATFDGYAKTFVNQLFTDTFSAYQYSDGSTKWVNTGIISMNNYFTRDDLVDERSNKAGYFLTEKTISLLSQNRNCVAYSYKPSTGNTSSNIKPGAGNQSTIAPMAVFDFTSKNYVAKVEDSNDYCYEDGGTVYISMDEGDTFNWDTSILTVMKNGQVLDYTVSMDGVDYTGKTIPFNASDEYEVKYSYTDPYNYTDDGEYTASYEKILKINVVVVQASAKNAEFSFGTNGTAYTSKTVVIGDDTYVMPNVTATVAGKIGSTTVNGVTVYYPITEMYTSDGKTEHTGSWYACFPIFKDAVQIIDYADSGTGDPVTYNQTNVTTVDGIPSTLKATDPASAFLYQMNATNYPPPTDPTAVSGAVCYTCNRNGLTASNTRTEFTITAKYTYQDNAGKVYYYYIGYHCPEQTKGSTGTCIAEGTLITMADGTKRAVEDLRKGDKVMAFDHLSGEITDNDVIIVVRTSSDFYKNTFVFDDGTQLATINEHGIYDLDMNKYVNITHKNTDEFIGHRYVAVDPNGKLSTKKLVNVITEFTSGYKYDIVTDQTLNYVAEDTLSVTHVLVDVINSFDFDSNMCYDQKKMQADIEKYGLYTYDEWDEYCDISVFEQYNIPVMKVGISKGLYTKEYIIGLINTYVLDESVQIID